MVITLFLLPLFQHLFLLPFCWLSCLSSRSNILSQRHKGGEHKFGICFTPKLKLYYCSIHGHSVLKLSCNICKSGIHMLVLKHSSKISIKSVFSFCRFSTMLMVGRYWQLLMCSRREIISVIICAHLSCTHLNGFVYSGTYSSKGQLE